MDASFLDGKTGWWFVLLLTAVGTYFWRALGVLIAGHINQESEIFRWLSAVTYAMVAALTFRLILLPVGLLSEIPLYYRILAALVGMAVVLSEPGRLVPALLVGSGMMVVYGIFQ